MIFSFGFSFNSILSFSFSFSSNSNLGEFFFSSLSWRGILHGTGCYKGWHTSFAPWCLSRCLSNHFSVTPCLDWSSRSCCWRKMLAVLLLPLAMVGGGELDLKKPFTLESADGHPDSTFNSQPALATRWLATGKKTVTCNFAFI